MNGEHPKSEVASSNRQLAETLRTLAHGYSTEAGRDVLLSAAQIVERARVETPDGWRPIETAPKHNCTVITLAWNPDDWSTGDGFYFKGEWIATGFFHSEKRACEVKGPAHEIREWKCEPKYWRPRAASPGSSEELPAQPDSDAEVFTRAVVAGVARWEYFTGSDDEGEVCVGGLRYATRLDVGVPVLGANLREALERHTIWKRQASTVSGDGK